MFCCFRRRSPAPGPFNVFASVDDAFGKPPAGTVETLPKPENKRMLKKVLTAHVGAGDISAAAPVVTGSITCRPCQAVR